MSCQVTLDKLKYFKILDKAKYFKIPRIFFSSDVSLVLPSSLLKLRLVDFCQFTLTFTYPLRAMWHIRPQNYPTNQLCQSLRFVPRSSFSIQLFPFLLLPSFSMLSLVCPVFVALLESRLMQSCSHWFFPHDVADEFPSSPSHVLAEVLHLSHLQDFFVCNSFLPAYLKYPSKTSVWKTSILFSSLLFIFHVSQPYIKTGFTSVLYSLTLVHRLMLLLLQVFFNLKNTPFALFYCSFVDV